MGTPRYQQTRQQHTKVERKLGEVARHQGQRRARYRGWACVKVQAVLTALGVNVKRLVQLLVGQVQPVVGTAPVRAELCGG